MSIEISLDMTGIDEAITDLMNAVSPDRMTIANVDIGRGVVDYIREWYREKGNDHFSNPSLPTHGSGRKSKRWAEQVYVSWHSEESSSGATVYFQSPSGESMGLGLKVKGGTVTAKRAKALTIPLVPEAHGVSASVYSKMTGTRLFVAGKKSTETGGALCVSDGKGGVKAIYALRKSVKFNPWPEAMPSDEELNHIALQKLGEVLFDGL